MSKAIKGLCEIFTIGDAPEAMKGFSRNQWIGDHGKTNSRGRILLNYCLEGIQAAYNSSPEEEHSVIYRKNDSQSGL